MGDYVTICLCLEHYTNHSFQRPYARAAEPLSIFDTYRSNAYLLDLPSDMNINHIFHVDDLTPY